MIWSNDPHAKGRLLQMGAPLEEAEGAVILLHGRDGSADDIMRLQPVLVDEVRNRKIAWLAPEAKNRTWYPKSFMARREDNEPYLSSALKRVESLIDMAAKAGVDAEKIVIGGFSQGACLSSEFVASHPARYGGVLVFTGGLVGPEGSKLSSTGNLKGTPALIFSGDTDPYIPWPRVEETARVLTSMGADVTLRCFPGRPHTVSPEELMLAGELVGRVFAQEPERA